jgi:hypothetical protein
MREQELSRMNVVPEVEASRLDNEFGQFAEFRRLAAC